MKKLINDLIQQGYLKSDLIIDAFSKIHRIDFVPTDLEMAATADMALPIGSGQTISQPLTVAFMLELLEPKPGQNILDVGSGSGWTVALLSQIVGEKGKITGVEIMPGLYQKGKENIDKYGFVKIGTAEMYCEDGKRGFAKNAPYDRILVSAAANEVPMPLKEQLKVGGKMVIPINEGIRFLEKKGESEFYEKDYPGFAFVPLV